MKFCVQNEWRVVPNHNYNLKTQSKISLLKSRFTQQRSILLLYRRSIFWFEHSKSYYYFFFFYIYEHFLVIPSNTVFCHVSNILVELNHVLFYLLLNFCSVPDQKLALTHLAYIGFDSSRVQTEHGTEWKVHANIIFKARVATMHACSCDISWPYTRTGQAI